MTPLTIKVELHTLDRPNVLAVYTTVTMPDGRQLLSKDAVPVPFFKDTFSLVWQEIGAKLQAAAKVYEDGGDTEAIQI